MTNTKTHGQRPKQSPAIREIRIDQLTANPRNVRKGLGEPEKLREMAATIAEHGVLEPVVVTQHPVQPDRWVVLMGHRRVAAAKLAGDAAVPCRIRHYVDDLDEQTILMLIENCHRADLDPIDKAEAFAVLRRSGRTLAEISEQTGFSESTISSSLALLDLDNDTRARVRDGVIGVGQARTAVRAVRRATGQQRGHAPTGRPTVVESAHFTARHPLAATVRAMCDHTQRPSVGRVGCGQCWEAVIRADATADGPVNDQPTAPTAGSGGSGAPAATTTAA